ncbi:hypothetical protein ATE68_00205 [Sphingopyxis sp. H038]|nr:MULTISPECIES: hypothetical protein [unclassified Sphingopyxis]KTE61708.1 hypothetical protein ATE74_20895 [Sphingopyxis sp. H085]KTE04128.1 hypothetical protein ATE78_00205 [Sphingopyxis sp. H012]KTE06026.1 hypothetical protein ATE70_22995 [Sphingopyxis sp. H053]KTE15643.1 hypothetical protein ATE76_02385 [Sphingopyxis sp. H093]KTE15886.1 hypothetical protein ATE76_03835 [Sphingopyxis sp. H093]
MTPYNRCLAGIAILLSGGTPASAHSDPGRCAGQTEPSARRGDLIVTQDASGFSIERRTVPILDPREPLAKTPVTLGAAHRIDRSIFLNAVAPAGDKFDARR